MTKAKSLFIAFLALLAIPAAASAAEIKTQNSVYLPSGQTVDGNLYAAGNNITIDGEIKGDLIAAAQTITVNGRLEGDLIAAAQTITVNGEVNGNIRIAANSARIEGPVARNVNYIGNSISIGKEAKIGWDLVTAAVSTDIAGTIAGNVMGDGDSVILSGKIGRNFDWYGNREGRTITLAPEALVNGDLKYFESSNLTIQEGATVAGSIAKKEWKPAEADSSGKLWGLIYSIFAAIVIGLVIIKPGRKIAKQMIELMQSKAGTTIISGILSFLAIPLVCLMLAFTIIGAPLALILFALWLIMFWVGKVIAAIFLGQAIVKRISRNDDSDRQLTFGLVIGCIIAWLLFAIPYIGWLFSVVATCIGLGAFLRLFAKK
ncbi:MAG: bactofilin family protein [Bacillota bacterium]